MAGSFYTIVCPDCSNEQVVFEKAASEVPCAVCGQTLAVPTGGTAEFTGDVIDVVEQRPEDSTEA